jgi:hypothetical protein
VGVKVSVGVNVIVGVKVIVGVEVIVEVEVSVGVKVKVGVAVGMNPFIKSTVPTQSVYDTIQANITPLPISTFHRAIGCSFK